MRTPLPTAEYLSGVASVSGRIVAAGGAGTVLDSADGTNWSVQRVGKEKFQSVASSGTTLLATSGGSNVWLSTDGLTWKPQTVTLPDQTSLGNLIWDGSRWVAFNDNYSTPQSLLVSTDGATWTKLADLPSYDTSTGLSRNINALAYTGTRYVVAGGFMDSNNQSSSLPPYLATTSDGTDWQEISLGDFSATTGNQVREVVWTGSQLVLVGTNDMVFTSPDGTTWTKRTMTSGGMYISALTWTGTQLVAFSRNFMTGGNGTTYTSTDGVAWTGTAAPDFGSFAITKATWTGSLVVAVDDSGSLFTSPTGSTFTRRLPTTSTSTASISAVGVSPTGLLALGTSGNGNVLKSTTGDTWTSATATGLSNLLTGVVWSGSQWVGMEGPTQFSFATSAIVATSSDGVAWHESSLLSNPVAFSRIAVGGGKLVVVGSVMNVDVSLPFLQTSTDGSTWTTPTLPAGQGRLSDITYTGSQWVAVGSIGFGGTGLVLTSPDGVKWTSRTMPGGGAINTVASSQALIVAVTNSGTLTSANGIAWVYHPFNIVATVTGSRLIWSGSDFIAVNYDDNRVQTSVDGVNWVEQDKGSDNPFNDIVMDATNHQVVAVGPNGMVMSSDAIPSVQFAQATQSTVEGNGTVYVTVQLGFPSTSPVTVGLTAGGSAVGGTDYQPAVPTTLTFNPGETMKVIPFTTVVNAANDPGKNIILTLNSPTGGRIGSVGVHTISITDNHTSPPVSFAHDRQAVNEDVGTVNVEVELGWASANTVSVPVATTGSTATAGTDYTGVPATLVFAPGERRKMITITVVDDTEVESDETVVLTLGTPTNGTLGNATTYTLTIKDNDPASLAGRNWTLRNPLPTSEGLNSVAATSSAQVIVGNNGLVLNSSNQGVSLSRVFTGSRANFWSVAYTSAGFLAVGDGGHVLTSAAGDIWFEQQVASSSGASFDFRAVGDGGAAGIVATGSTTNNQNGQSLPVVFYSPDGQTWSERPLPDSAQGTGQGVARSPSLFVVVGGGYSNSSNGYQTLILTSLDGLVWTDHSNAVQGVWFKSVVWKGNKFLAVDGSNKGYTSADGVTWDSAVAGTLGGLSAATYDGVSKVVAVGSATASAINGSGGVITEHPSGTPVTLVSVAYTGSGYLAVGGSGTIMTSADGNTWARSPASQGVDQSGGQGNGFLGVAWSGTQFVAVGGVHPGSALAVTSPDGITWTPHPVTDPDVLADVAWSGTQFVAVGLGGAIRTSPDGVTWTPKNSGVTLDLHKILWAGGQFVIVGGNEQGEGATTAFGSVVLTSTNGTTWTRRSVPTGHPLEGIAYTGALFVATGRQGELLTSPDAITWTHQASGVTSGDDLGAIVWNGSKLVTGTADLEIISSPDGVTWTPATSVPDLHLQHSGDALGGATWTGTQFVLTGHQGAILTSLDGLAWTAQDSRTSNDLHGVCWNGSTLVIVGLNSTILSSGSGAPPPPTVQFAASQSTVLEGATANLLVTMSSPPTVKTTVPYTLGFGTATGQASAADVVAPAVLTLVFNPGETAKFITLPTKNDLLAEGDETLPVTLQMPAAGATLGATITHTLTIKDNDVAPSITFPPQHQLVAVGDSLAIISAASGTGTLTYQWMKDGKAVAGATQPVYFVPSAALTHAGAYILVVKSAVGTATSNPVQVGVFDGSHRVSAVASGASSITLTQTAAGNGLTYQWVDGADMPVIASPGHLMIAGNTITISNVMGGDAGVYQCKVSQTASSLLDNATRYQLNVVSAAPSFTTTSLTLSAGATVGVPYSASVASALSPGSFATFTASGLLPLGLSIDAFGTITGTPTVAVNNKTVTITATNAKGVKSIPATITISPQPAGFAGVWSGLMERSPDINNSLGSSVQITVSTAGSFTGKVTSGATTTSFTSGALEIAANGQSATGTAITLLGAGRAMQVSFSITFGTLPPLMSGTISTGFTGAPPTGNANFSAWQALSASATYAGLYNFALDLPGASAGDASVPQGTGYGTLKVGTAGTWTGTIGLGDGSVFTASGPVIGMGLNAQCQFYKPLYNSTGSVMGSTLLLPGGAAPAYLDSEVRKGQVDVTWGKLPDASAASARNYPQGWMPLTLQVSGSKYPIPGSTELIMGLGTNPSANFNLSVDSVSDSTATLLMTVNRTGTGTVASLNPSPFDTLTLTVTPKTGAFNGTFGLTNTNDYPTLMKRSSSYNGLIVRTFNGTSPVYRGVGWFLLPQLPDLNVSPLPAATSTPILAGSVLLTPAGP